MPLHPQAQQVIEATRALGLPPNHTVSPAEARANAAKRPRGPGPEVGKVENRSVPGPAGDVPVRIYTPEGNGPFPILVWYHGGGWVVGNLESADGTARHLCAGSRSIVVSVDYRLSPEAKFPEPFDDCYYATIWASDHAEELGGVRGVVSVGGDSAGGNLAAAVSIKAAETGDFRVSHQLLVYPVTDVDFDTGSYLDNGAGYNLDRDLMIWYWEQYLADPAQAADPLVAPLRLSADFEGIDDLAQALVITAEYDPLRDEGEAYGRHLNELGVPAQSNRYDGMIHGFFSMAGVLDTGRDAMDDACRFLRGAVDDMTEEYFQQHEGDPAAMRKLLDPQAAEVLMVLESLGIKAFQDMDVDECREVMNNRPRPKGPEVGRVEDRVIMNEHGKEPGEVPIRIYTPATPGPWGTLVWYHGGGWVIGNVETADATARELCVGADCVVVSVDYRLAPEYKFPTPFEDCLTATMWAMANAEVPGQPAGCHRGGRRQRRRQPGRGGVAGAGRLPHSAGLPAVGVSGHRLRLRDAFLPGERAGYVPGNGQYALVLGPLRPQQRPVGLQHLRVAAAGAAVRRPAASPGDNRRVRSAAGRRAKPTPPRWKRLESPPHSSATTA